jgi:hypothetical protein
VDSGSNESSAGPGTGRLPSWTPPHAGGPPPTAPQVMRPTSGLFPSGPPRPIFREAFPVRGGAVALGMVGGGLWMMLFGLLASDAGGYAWISILAGLVAWLVALLLARLGDRGAAVGLAMSTAVGLAIAMFVVAVRWTMGDWVLW